MRHFKRVMYVTTVVPEPPKLIEPAHRNLVDLGTAGKPHLAALEGPARRSSSVWLKRTPIQFSSLDVAGTVTTSPTFPPSPRIEESPTPSIATGSVICSMRFA